MWVYNSDGDQEMQGWVYQQGEWSWGSVLTWHVTDLGDQYHGHDYVWACYLWVWNWDEGWWFRRVNVPLMEVHPLQVGFCPWMEHSHTGNHLMYS